MKNKRLIVFTLGVACSLTFLTGCMAGMFEEELTITFATGGEVIGTGTVTQFKNIKSPVLADGYIPKNYRFLGWTPYAEEELDLKDPVHFKTQYIGGGRMVHYMDAKPFAKNRQLTYEALIMDKDDIPKVYHYAVVAWYDKAGTSGLTQDKIDAYETKMKSWLGTQGVSEEDINSVLFRGYSGQVGPTTGQILYDDDVDIMFGWGSLSNITTTGSIPPEMVKQSENFQVTYNGDVKERTIHRLSDNEGCLKVMQYMLSEESRNFFKE